MGFLAMILTVAAIGFGLHYYWVHRFDSLMVEVAGKYNLEPALVKAIVYEESFFNPGARSRQNAVGLMQVTPIAAREWLDVNRMGSLAQALAELIGKEVEADIQLDDALKDPEVSLHVGCWYLRSLLDRYRNERSNLAVSLAAYNAGPTNVDRWAPSVERSTLSDDEFIARIDFPATRTYVRRVIERYQQYRLQGNPSS